MGTMIKPKAFLRRLGGWLVNAPPEREPTVAERSQLDGLRVAPFALIHLGSAAAIWTGVSPTALAVCASLYCIRMFFITGFYHRYFSHRAYTVGRMTQFVMALLGCTAGQRSPVWWAAHHRAHHGAADTENDPHSPRHHGFFFSHTLWFLTRGTHATPTARVKDWLRFPELRWLDRFDWIPFASLGIGSWLLGDLLAVHASHLETSGAQMFVVGFLWSTVLLYHATYTTNSIAHRFGTRRYATRDDSRNNVWVALLTLGEGWHNNHHHYPAAARQGFLWWELDISWIALRGLAALGIVRNLKGVPDDVLHRGRVSEGGS